MAQATVLQIVQDIMSDMDSDAVNSITDTEESLQVANIVETTYFELMSNRDWPHLRQLIQLNAATSARPTHMQIPDAVQELLWIKYDRQKTGATKKDYDTIIYQEPESFINYVMTRDSSASNIETITVPGGADILIKNDVAPTYWTTVDDEYIVFDSYDSAVDTFMQQSKTLVEANLEPTFSKVDTHVPDLPSKFFSLFLAECKSVAFNALKQFPNPKEEQRVRRQSVYISRNSRRAAGGIKTNNYGRK